MRLGRPPALLVGTFLLLALLPLLAGLQYHWLGQLSQNERERMKTNLSTATTRFSEDFDRELTRVYSTFHQVESSEADAEAQQISESLLRWGESPFPSLLKDVYVADELSPDQGHRLRRYDSVRKTLDPADWPPSLIPIQNRLTSRAAGPHPPAVVFEDVPLVLIPRLAPVERAIETLQERLGALKEDRENIRMLMGPSAFVIVLLDEEYIRREFLPALVEKHFSGGGPVDYNVAIVSKNRPQRYFFRSDEAATFNTFASADASADIVRLRLDSLVFVAATEPVDALPPAGIRVGGGRVSVTVLSDGKNRIVRSFQFAEKSSESLWQVVATHRTGSVEAAIAQVRRRNLAVSFGVVLLLGLSAAVLLATTSRAQRLAKQQFDFVAGVSHELRTPLAVIRSAGENLADGVVENIEQSRKYGTMIRNEGRRLSEMVEQILAFAGIQGQRKAYDLKLTNVVEVVRGALDDACAFLESKGFEVSRDLPAEPIVILADHAALRMAVQNLLNNAAKYATADKWVGVAVEQAGDSVFIRIQDQGIGISSADLPHIFEPFYRGRGVVDSQIHGSGLGLSLVKHVVDEHRGAITVDTAPKRGTIFTLKFRIVPT